MQVVVEPAELDAARSASDSAFLSGGVCSGPANYVDSFAAGDEEGCAPSEAQKGAVLVKFGRCFRTDCNAWRAVQAARLAAASLCKGLAHEGRLCILLNEDCVVHLCRDLASDMTQCVDI